MSSDLSSSIADHYARGNIIESILGALESMGKDTEHLSLDDLEPVEEFHFRGREGTKELAEQLSLNSDHRVLDVGSGVGGPARYLAATYGCHVTGIDVTQEYCEVAEELSRRAGLAEKTKFVQGDAAQLPFDDKSFDRIITEHVNMNVPDKDVFYGEIFRVLKSGGLLGTYEIVAGTGEELDFPVPWARTSETSFLAFGDELKAAVERAGFRVSAWNDVSEQGLAWFQSLVEQTQRKGISPLGLPLLLGEQAPTMLQNVGKNLSSGRIAVIQAIAKK